MLFSCISLQEMLENFSPYMTKIEDLERKRFYFITTYVGERSFSYQDPFFGSGFERDLISKITYQASALYPTSTSGCNFDVDDIERLPEREREERIKNFNYKVSMTLNTVISRSTLSYIINGAIMKGDDIFFVFDNRKGIPFRYYAASLAQFLLEHYNLPLGNFETYLGKGRDHFEITDDNKSEILSQARADLLSLEAQGFEAMQGLGDYFYPSLEAFKFQLKNNTDFYIEVASELGLDKKYNIIRAKMPLQERLALIQEEIQTIEDRNYHLLKTTEIDDLKVIDLLWFGSLVGLETKVKKDMSELTRDELLNLLYEAGQKDLEKERFTRPNLLSMDIITLDKIRTELGIPYSPYNGQLEFNKMIDAILVAKGNKIENFKLPHSSELMQMGINELYDIYINEYNGDPVRIKREDIHYIPKESFVKLLISMERARMERDGLMGLTVERLENMVVKDLKLLFRNILRTRQSRDNILPYIMESHSKRQIIDFVCNEFSIPSEYDDLKNHIPSEDVLKSMLKKDLYDLALKLRLNVNSLMNKHDILAEIIYYRRDIELQKARAIILGEVTVENLMLLSKDKLIRICREYNMPYRVSQSKISIAKTIVNKYNSGKIYR